MTDHRTKWMKKMVAIHGSEEAVSQFMRKSSNKRTVHAGGDHLKGNPKRAKEIGDKGRETQRRIREEKTTQEGNTVTTVLTVEEESHEA